MNEAYRPVKVRKIVQGYYCAPDTTDFRFEMSLNYKVAQVIQSYSNNKPTLIVNNNNF